MPVTNDQWKRTPVKIHPGHVPEEMRINCSICIVLTSPSHYGRS